MPSPQPPPKVLIFDIGGVCVVSPFQAILDYELANSIPPGWINHCISRSGPTGAWQRLERGEIQNDPAFFQHFNADLHREDLWHAYCAAATAKGVRGATGNTQVAPGTQNNVVTITAASQTHQPVPQIDGEWLFWQMMSISREPDAYMLPALRKLKKSGRFVLAALSNTNIFPAEHAFSKDADTGAAEVKKMFDVFVSSAHVGLRKPERPIYELAMKMVREEWVRQGRGEHGEEVKEGDVVFLDDIGENLKMGRTVGWRTVKVHLGRTKEAVKELEEITGLKLAWESARL